MILQSLVIDVMARASPNPPRAWRRPNPILIISLLLLATACTSTGPERAPPLDEWLQNDGELLNQALDESVAGMAEQMAKDIRYKD